jgi:phosphatidate phosphatase APP1
MLYVSRAPWGIYEVLEEFFDLNGIPTGPILFLGSAQGLCNKPRQTGQTGNDRSPMLSASWAHSARKRLIISVRSGA